ncbi:MAG: hypothetical protein DCF25_16510 [Leptolyngbya foveolarum]|uniref:FtsK domain-containing protein n=1 Tax=Leptolyngbya foveolarum TaxID=47253 RepID=A0A2W4VLM8_9CYAN|nr:MAG: hypothetical protein DCF25_16510 [Leptolyngbya foveolarum]
MFWKSRSTAAIAEPDLSDELAELLLHSVEKLSEVGADTKAGCEALAKTLSDIGADVEQVRAIACDVVYEGDVAKAEGLMGHLARYGYGSGAVTIRQPDKTNSAPLIEDNRPQLCETNLLAELASPKAYSAVLLGDTSVGVATLIQALIGAQLRHPCGGISLVVADMRNEPSWKGLEAIDNTVIQLPSRDPAFLKTAAEVVGQVAREIQGRVAQRSIKARAASLGAAKWPSYLLAINGWQAVTEALSLLSNKQTHDHDCAGQLLSDLRYCLTTGPNVNISIILGADRLSNCALTETALENARVFALGAVRPGGKGGYRAIDAILMNKSRLPDPRDRSGLAELLYRCKTERIPVVLALSGLPRLGLFKDFRDETLDLKALYELRRVSR